MRGLFVVHIYGLRPLGTDILRLWNEPDVQTNERMNDSSSQWKEKWQEETTGNSREHQVPLVCVRGCPLQGQVDLAIAVGLRGSCVLKP